MTPKRVLNEHIINLNIRDIPGGFNYYDLDLITKEFRDSTLLINLPFNKEKQSFHEYCFILMTCPRKASEFCYKFDRKSLVDIYGQDKVVSFHQGNNTPKNFLIRVLNSKAMCDPVIFFL